MVDSRPARALEEVRNAADAARAERNAFAAEAAELLRDADAREQMAHVGAALEGEDPTALRDALAQLPPADPASLASVLTTDDLPAGARR